MFKGNYFKMEMIKERPFRTSVICVQGYLGTGVLHAAQAVVPFYRLGRGPAHPGPTAGFLLGQSKTLTPTFGCRLQMRQHGQSESNMSEYQPAI